jgi:hypothetical protein
MSQPNEPAEPGQPYSYPPPVDPFTTSEQPVYQPAAPVYQPAAPVYQPAPPVYQQAPPGYGYPAVPPPEPPKKKRRGLLITAIVLGFLVLLCGGGGTAAYFLVVKNADGTGAQAPETAVNDFLVAVYTEKDVDKAAALVCSEARSRDDLTKKINEVKQYASKFKEPKFSWETPKVADAKAKSAEVDVIVKITTDDERIAQQPLKFTVVKKTGWFVCEVQQG